LRAALWKEAIEQHPLDFGTRQLRRPHRREEPGPATGQCDRERLVRTAVAGEQSLFEIPAPGDQVVPLSAQELAALPGQSRFEEVCDREIDIVAAQQDVVADGFALD